MEEKSAQFLALPKAIHQVALLQPETHSHFHHFIHSFTQLETHIECVLCTKHKPRAMSNTQTLPQSLTHQCKQGTVLMNHEYPPGLPQLTGQAHQHKMVLTLICGEDCF